MKTKKIYVCQNCGYESPKWLGQCPQCHAWNSFQEVTVAAKTTAKKQPLSTSQPLALNSIPALAPQNRLKTNFREFDRVLGGGIVPGAVILLAGEPGIGKSTLLSQLAIALAKDNPQRQIYYLCGEESPQQVKLRLQRLAKDFPGENFFLLPELDVDASLATIRQALGTKPGLVIVDSIQTMTSQDASGGPGSLNQTRLATNLWRQFAKETATPVFLVGHVTKGGLIAGPKTLEHMVDVVLSFVGDRQQQLRLLRATKNRFGPTAEVGVWQMTDHGLEEVDPGQLWQQKDKPPIGAAATIVLEGNRPLTLEIQALVSQSFLPTPKRVINGLDYNRAQIVLAVLQKYLRLPLYKYDVFVNVSGGLQTREPAADLALAASILSSYYNRPLPSDSWFLGEISLLGEIRPVNQLARRQKQAQSLGLKKAYSWENLTNLRQLVPLVRPSK